MTSSKPYAAQVPSNLQVVQEILGLQEKVGVNSPTWVPQQELVGRLLHIAGGSAIQEALERAEKQGWIKKGYDSLVRIGPNARYRVLVAPMSDAPDDLPAWLQTHLHMHWEVEAMPEVWVARTPAGQTVSGETRVEALYALAARFGFRGGVPEQVPPDKEVQDWLNVHEPEWSMTPIVNGGWCAYNRYGLGHVKATPEKARLWLAYRQGFRWKGLLRNELEPVVKDLPSEKKPLRNSHAGVYAHLSSLILSECTTKGYGVNAYAAISSAGREYLLRRSTARAILEGCAAESCPLSEAGPEPCSGLYPVAVHLWVLGEGETEPTKAIPDTSVSCATWGEVERFAEGFDAARIRRVCGWDR